MSTLSTAAVGVGVGLAVGAAASAAAAALWCTAPAAGGITRPEARTLKPSALRRRALELGVPVAEIDDAEDVGGVDGLATLVQAAQTAQRGGRDDGVGALAGETECQALRVELSGLRIAALRGRAASAGIAEDQVDATYDADDPKAALVELILGVEARSSTATAATTIVGTLQHGGEPALAAVGAILAHAIEVLEQHMALAPRDSCRALLDAIERAESTAEALDAAWCDAVRACDAAALAALSHQLAVLQGLSV
eukprot:COSAG06_NODE_1987_length_7906_cov_36.391315_14_plen_253_part_01